MNRTEAVRGQLAAIAALEGMRGCAIADVETGMAWHWAGEGAVVQLLCEAATDYWRLCLRQRRHFEPELGEVRAQVLVHARGRLTLVDCRSPLLLVCLSAEPDRVDWERWKPLVARLRMLAAAL